MFSQRSSRLPPQQVLVAGGSAAATKDRAAPLMSQFEHLWGQQFHGHGGPGLHRDRV